MDSFDHALIGNKPDRRTAREASLDEEETEVVIDDLEDTSSMAEVPAGRDARSSVCDAIPVPQKEIDME